MQLDEAYTYNEYASKPVLDGLSWYTLPNNHLLNTLLIHVSTVVLGNAPWVVRLAALAAGLGLIPAILCPDQAALRPRRGASGGGPGCGVGAVDRLFDERPWLHDRRSGDGPPGPDGRANRADGRGGRVWDWVGFTILPAVGCFAIPIMLYPYGGILLWLVLGARGRGAGSRGGFGSIAWSFPWSSPRS